MSRAGYRQKVLCIDFTYIYLLHRHDILIRTHPKSTRVSPDSTVTRLFTEPEDCEKDDPIDANPDPTPPAFGKDCDLLLV